MLHRWIITVECDCPCCKDVYQAALPIIKPLSRCFDENDGIVKSLRGPCCTIDDMEQFIRGLSFRYDPTPQTFNDKPGKKKPPHRKR